MSRVWSKASITASGSRQNRSQAVGTDWLCPVPSHLGEGAFGIEKVAYNSGYTDVVENTRVARNPCQAMRSGIDEFES